MHSQPRSAVAIGCAVLGIDPTTEVEIKQNLIIFTSGSLSGRERRVIPVQSVNTACWSVRFTMR